jgi:hypothetical protein
MTAPPAARRDAALVALLMAAAILASFALACATPFAAFAVLAAATLPRPRALLLVAGAWVANQLVGYLALGYPWTADSALWGAAIGIAALLATMAAAALLPRLAAPLPLRLAAGFAAAFAVYEVSLLALGLATGDTAPFAPAIVIRLALEGALFLAALAAAHRLLLSPRGRAVAAR